VKDFFAAIDRGEREGLLVAQDIEWIIPGEDLAAGRTATRGLADWVKTQSETMGISLTEPREFCDQGLEIFGVKIFSPGSSDQVIDAWAEEAIDDPIAQTQIMS
jgi:hypothetical protein